MSFLALALAAAITAPEPIAPPTSWFSDADYPEAALEADKEGSVRVTLEVGADGFPKSCVVAVSSGHAELDSKTCELFKSRAKFKPAVDAHGKAVPGTYSQLFVWRIPREVLETQGLIVDFSIGRDGRVSGCTETWIGSPRGWMSDNEEDEVSCEAFSSANSDDVLLLLLGTSLQPFSSVQVRILGLVDDLNPPAIGEFDERRVIVSGTIAVSAAGVIIGCTEDASFLPEFIGQGIHMCEDFPAGRRDFEADPKGRSRKLKFIFDVVGRRGAMIGA